MVPALSAVSMSQTHVGTHLLRTCSNCFTLPSYANTQHHAYSAGTSMAISVASLEAMLLSVSLLSLYWPSACSSFPSPSFTQWSGCRWAHCMTVYTICIHLAQAKLANSKWRNENLYASVDAAKWDLCMMIHISFNFLASSLASCWLLAGNIMIFFFFFAAS